MSSYLCKRLKVEVLAHCASSASAGHDAVLLVVLLVEPSHTNLFYGILRNLGEVDF